MAIRLINWRGERNQFGRISAASMLCPNCENRTYTGAHEILDDGRIIPAIECDHECGFFEHVVLAGWCHGYIPNGGPR